MLRYMILIIIIVQMFIIFVLYNSTVRLKHQVEAAEFETRTAIIMYHMFTAEPNHEIIY